VKQEYQILFFKEEQKREQLSCLKFLHTKTLGANLPKDLIFTTPVQGSPGASFLTNLFCLGISFSHNFPNISIETCFFFN